jgi:hypothetical protein
MSSPDSTSVSATAAAAVAPSTGNERITAGVEDVTVIGLSPDSPLTNSVSPTDKSIRIHPDLLTRGIEYVKNTIIPLVVGGSKDIKNFPYVEVATELMSWIEKTQGFLHGFDKKRIVLRIMETIVEKQEELLGGSLAGHEEEASTIIRNVIPATMDFIVAASKGKLELNHAKKAVKHCLPVIGKVFSSCFKSK